MKNIQNILFGILTIAVITLYFLHFKSSSPKVNLNPTKGDMTSAMGTRVAFINTDSFFEKYNEYKKIKSEIESAQKAGQASLENKMKAFQADYVKYMQQAQSGQTNPQKEQELMARQKAIQAEEANIGKGLSSKLDDATKALYKKMNDYFVENKAKYNCDYVMGYQTNGAILYFDPQLDITNQVVEDLNKK